MAALDVAHPKCLSFLQHEFHHIVLVYSTGSCYQYCKSLDNLDDILQHWLLLVKTDEDSCIIFENSLKHFLGYESGPRAPLKID